MSDLDYVKAVLLGIVQGATEFLPVSSSGHLALSQRFFGLDAAGSEMLLFDVLAHVGTLVAVLVVFAGSIRRYILRLRVEAGSSYSGRRYAWRVMGLGIAASVPTAAIGLTFKDELESAFDRPALIGACLIATGLLLAATSMCPRGRKGWRNFGYLAAVVVGVAQGLAILPGISRSGATICTAVFLGLRRRWAGEFSFFIAVPAILGASVLKVADVFELSPGEWAGLNWGPIVAGAVVSLAVGVLALGLLLNVIRRAKLHYFACYCWILGVLALTM